MLIFEDDLIIGQATGLNGGPDIPDALKNYPLDRLRLLDNQIVDAADYSSFWIDEVGRKHLIQKEDSWKQIDCAFDAQLIKDYGQWRIKTAPDELKESQERALIQIDVTAEEVRKQFATPGSLQAMVYLEKAEEARAYQAATNPIDADYPFLKAEASALAMDIADFAALVLENRDAWTNAAADIEAIRAGTKAAVRKAPDQSAIDTILNGLNWPTPQ